MLRAIVKQNKSSLNNFYPKFLLTDQNFDTIQTLADLSDVNSVIMEEGDYIIESLTSIGLGDVLLYGVLNGMSFVIMKKEKTGPNDPNYPPTDNSDSPYFIDGYSLTGSGTSEDPIVYTGTPNTLGEDSLEFENASNPLPIPNGLVWFSGDIFGVTQSQSLREFKWESGVGVIDETNYYERVDPVNNFSVPSDDIFPGAT